MTLSKNKTVSLNRSARHNYFIESTIEAGLILLGTEVKSLREGQGSIKEAHATVEEDEAFLYNAFIPEYKKASAFNHAPRRQRKLLLHRREIQKLHGFVRRRGKTLIPLSLYFNAKGKAKIELGIAEGKKKVDKRQALKERDWKIQKARILKDNR